MWWILFEWKQSWLILFVLGAFLVLLSGEERGDSDLENIPTHAGASFFSLLYVLGQHKAAAPAAATRRWPIFSAATACLPLILMYSNHPTPHSPLTPHRNITTHTETPLATHSLPAWQKYPKTPWSLSTKAIYRWGRDHCTFYIYSSLQASSPNTNTTD